MAGSESASVAGESAKGAIGAGWQCAGTSEAKHEGSAE